MTKTKKVVTRTPRRPGDVLKDLLTGWAFIGPATVIIMSLSLFPAGWAWFLAQQKWNGFSAPKNIGAKNYVEMMSDTDLFASVTHTLFYSALFIPTSVLGGLFIAVALNRQIRFIGFYRTCIFVPFVASATAIGILANYIFDPQFGFANMMLQLLGLPRQSFLEDPQQAMVVIAVMSLWAQLGFTSVVYMAALQDVPPDLTEAAAIDGASKWQAFWYVVWPELTPVTVFTSIWQLIGALQLFDIVFTTTRGGPMGATQTIVYYLWDQAFQQLRFGYGSAIAYGLFALTLLITLAMLVYSRLAKVQAF